MDDNIETLIEKLLICPNIDAFRQITNSFNNDSNDCNVDELVRTFDSLLCIQRQLTEKNYQLNEAFLIALGSALYKRSTRLSKYHETLLGSNSILDKHMSSVHLCVQRCATMCIRNLTMKDALSDDYPLTETLRTWCFNKLLSIVSLSAHYREDFDSYKLLSGAWEGLQNLLESNFKPSNDVFGRLFGAVCASICFGLPGLPIIQPCTITPSTTLFQKVCDVEVLTETQRSTTKKSKRNDKKLRKHRLSKSDQSDHPSSESSDTETLNKSDFRTSFGHHFDVNSNKSGFTGVENSDFSDSTSSKDGYRVGESFKSVSMRIRFNAFRVLELCTKVCESKILFGYWFRFFPETNMQSYGTLSIFQTLMKESSFKVRISALNAVRSWLETCRPMLGSAEIRSKPASFTSFSETLASSLIEIHRSLSFVLSAEKYSAAIAQCTRCFATFITVTPFEKFPKQLLSKTLSQCKALLVHKDVSVRLGAMSVCCASVKTNCPEELEILLLPASRPWLLDVCSSFVLKECAFLDVHCFNSTPVNVEALQILTAMYAKHGKLIEGSVERCIQVGFKCINTTEIELQLHGLKLLNALFAIDIPVKGDIIQFDRILAFLSPPSASSVNILIESLELCSKFVEKNVSLDNLGELKPLFLHFSTQNGHLVQATALKLLPIMLRQFKYDMPFFERCFDAVLSVLETASANIAERAGSSFIYMTRIIALNQNVDEVIRNYEFEIVQKAIVRALRFAQTSSVLRLKPACISATNLFLENFSNDSASNSLKFIPIIDLLIPMIVEYCNVEVVKVQQTALESSAAIFTFNERVFGIVGGTRIVIIVKSVVDVLRKPTLKLRNELLASKALSLVPLKMWQFDSKHLIGESFDALIGSLERLDVEAYDKHVENSVKESVAHEIVHCMILILPFASTTDVDRLRLQDENVQKTLCYYIDLYKGTLFHRNEFSSNANKEIWSIEYWKCLEYLEKLSNDFKDDLNLTLLLSLFRD